MRRQWGNHHIRYNIHILLDTNDIILVSESCGGLTSCECTRWFLWPISSCSKLRKDKGVELPKMDRAHWLIVFSWARGKVELFLCLSRSHTNKHQQALLYHRSHQWLTHLRLQLWPCENDEWSVHTSRKIITKIWLFKTTMTSTSCTMQPWGCIPPYPHVDTNSVDLSSCHYELYIMNL